MTLCEKYQGYFKIGAAVGTETIKTHGDLLFSHFNSITCENEMKPCRISPEEDDYRFEAADAIVAEAKRHQMTVREHTLVWHNQTPAWIFEGKDRAVLLENMHRYIAAVGRHYKDTFDSVDVVNEAIEDKGNGFLRVSPWSAAVGEDFISHAFLFAAEAFPDAVLYYNDYNEYMPEKREKIYRKLKEMRSEGIPVGGMGLQMHINLWEPSVDLVKAAIERYASLDLRLQITEMDVSMYRFEDRTHLASPDRKLLKEQAKVYGSLFKVFREYREVIDAVTLWGVADDRTWLSNFPEPNRKNWPLLFDEKHQPKEALDAVMDF